MQRKTSTLRALVFGAVAWAAATFPASPASGTSAERQTSRACATAKGSNCSAASASASAGASGSGRTSSSPAGSMSSTVNVGPGGLTGTTAMPDGSTVSITPGRATSATDDCVDTLPRDGTSRGQRRHNGKQATPQKENRR